MSAKPEVRFEVATQAHGDQLAATMRGADAAECMASGTHPFDAIASSLQRSEVAYAMLIDGEVAALFGVARLQSASLLGPTTVGVGWALTSTVVDKHPLTFMRWSRPALAVLREHCPCLANKVDARYQGALDWLEVLGFSIGPPVKASPNDVPFCLVSIGGE